MAFSLAKLVTKSVLLFRPVTKSVLLFRPVAAAASCRFINTDTILCQSDFDPFDYEGTRNLNGRFCNDDILRVRKVLDDAYCPEVSATRNLDRLLNFMDEKILNTYDLGHCRCPRWNVMEDAKALYLVCDMSTFAKENNVKEEKVTRQCSVFGCVTVTAGLRSIQVIVGRNGPNPGVDNAGYLIDIYLPASVYKQEVWDTITKDVKNDVLKITIPKKTGNIIRSITTQLKFYK